LKEGKPCVNWKVVPIKEGWNELILQQLPNSVKCTYLKSGHGSLFMCLYIINTHFTTSKHYCLYVIHPINFSNCSHLLHHWSSWQGSHVSTIPWSIILIPMSIFRIWKTLKMYYTSKSATVWFLTYHITHHVDKYKPITPRIQRNNTDKNIILRSKWIILRDGSFTRAAGLHTPRNSEKN